jgi:hypothetical protein
MIRTGILGISIRKNSSVKFGRNYIPSMNKICAHNSVPVMKEAIENKKTENSAK